MIKLPPFDPASRIHIDLGNVVMACVGPEDTMRIINDPVPGHKLRIRNLTNNLAIIMEEDGEDFFFFDAMEIGTIGALDPKSHEAFRLYRSITGTQVNPLLTLPTRKPPPVPEGMHAAFWAFVR